MVVYPHGGPHARDSWGFDEIVQFMASRGYAVLQVNFRGSTGYGQAWYEAGLRKWGTVMVDDVNAATRWADRAGHRGSQAHLHRRLEFRRVCGAHGRDPRAGSVPVRGSIAGVSDLRALRWQMKSYYGGAQAADYRRSASDSDELAAGSPLQAAQQIKAPVLLVHGKLDLQVDRRAKHDAWTARSAPRSNVSSCSSRMAIIRCRATSGAMTLLTKLEAFLPQLAESVLFSGARAPQRKTPP